MGAQSSQFPHHSRGSRRKKERTELQIGGSSPSAESVVPASPFGVGSKGTPAFHSFDTAGNEMVQ